MGRIVGVLIVLVGAVAFASPFYDDPRGDTGGAGFGGAEGANLLGACLSDTVDGVVSTCAGADFAIPSDTDLPATCSVGEIFVDTDDDDCLDAGGGSGTMCICTSTDNWTGAGGGGSGFPLTESVSTDGYCIDFDSVDGNTKICGDQDAGVAANELGYYVDGNLWALIDADEIDFGSSVDVRFNSLTGIDGSFSDGGFCLLSSDPNDGVCMQVNHGGAAGDKDENLKITDKAGAYKGLSGSRFSAGGEIYHAFATYMDQGQLYFGNTCNKSISGGAAAASISNVCPDTNPGQELGIAIHTALQNADTTAVLLGTSVAGATASDDMNLLCVGTDIDSGVSECVATIKGDGDMAISGDLSVTGAITSTNPRDFGPLAGDPSPTPVAVDGETYYNTDLDMRMQYDATRAKWLSIESAYIYFGRKGDVNAGTYFEGRGDLFFTSTLGFVAAHNATVVELTYTRANTDAVTFNVYDDGSTSGASLASTALKGKSTALDSDIAVDSVIGVFNSGANKATDVYGWVKLRWRD